MDRGWKNESNIGFLLNESYARNKGSTLPLIVIYVILVLRRVYSKKCSMYTLLLFLKQNLKTIFKYIPFFYYTIIPPQRLNPLLEFSLSFGLQT